MLILVQMIAGEIVMQIKTHETPVELAIFQSNSFNNW